MENMSESRELVALSASDRNSFAYPTLKDRVPIILCKVIDLLHRQRLPLGIKDTKALKDVIEKMAKLRYELQTNKPFAEINDDRDDQTVWNEYLKRRTDIDGETPKWFNTCWMYAECYAYRRLLECMAASPELRDHDCFAGQKKDAFKDNLKEIDLMTEQMERLTGGSKHLTSPDSLTNDFRNLLETSLWGNKCDLSISAGNKQECAASSELSQYRDRLLVDDWLKVWDCLMNARLSDNSSTDGTGSRSNENTASASNFHRQTSTSSNGGGSMVAFHDIVIDIVMDNAGFELFSDLCLADFLITTGLASLVRLRVKVHPWFVSDTSQKDVDWVLNQMAEGAKQYRQLNAGSDTDDVVMSRMKQLSEKWARYLSSGAWTVHSDPFWTYPHDFSQMKSDDPDLYRSLSEATLIIFKGDLNYRKLVGDMAWEPTTTFEEALQGFHPAPLVSLRTLKADVVVGLVEGQAAKARDSDTDWMINGNWGLIQFCDKRERLHFCHSPHFVTLFVKKMSKKSLRAVVSVTVSPPGPMGSPPSPFGPPPSPYKRS